MTTPEIKDLILPLEQYMTPDQKAELEKILSIGKIWKEIGEHKEKEFRENNDIKKFHTQILNYPEKKKKREKENQKTLEEI
jgi:hypothetical protein